MTRNLRVAALLALLGLVALGIASANPCANPCGSVSAEPITSSSTAQGESTRLVVWTHCHHTQYPHTSDCDDFGPSYVYAGTKLGPSAACAKGVLYADGQLVAQSLWVC